MDASFRRADALGARTADQSVVRAGRVGVSRTGQHGALVRWEQAGLSGRGPSGITGAPLQAKAGVSLDIGVWVSRDGEASEDERPINMKWFKHQGPATSRSPSGPPASSGMRGLWPVEPRWLLQ